MNGKRFNTLACGELAAGSVARKATPAMKRPLGFIASAPEAIPSLRCGFPDTACEVCSPQRLFTCVVVSSISIASLPNIDLLDNVLLLAEVNRSIPGFGRCQLIQHVKENVVIVESELLPTNSPIDIDPGITLFINGP